MQCSSDVQIPDGILAANALLAENSRQGFGASTHTLYQGFEVAISSTALGIPGTLYDGRVRCRYTGKERDAESGLDNFGARYYGSNMGRFMSPDWSATYAPVPYAKLDNPQSLNLYGYVGNNPLSSVDADGHAPQYVYDKDWIGVAKGFLWGLGKAFGGFRHSHHLADMTQDQRAGALLGFIAPAALSSGESVAATPAMELTSATIVPESINVVGEVAAPVLETQPSAISEGSFSISDWSGYPSGVPQPTGPFTLIEGAEYDAARSAANSANRGIRQADPATYAGQQIHEIQPVKFGGSPTDPANKIPLSPSTHSRVTNWWNSLMRSLQ